MSKTNIITKIKELNLANKVVSAMALTAVVLGGGYTALTMLDQNSQTAQAAPVSGSSTFGGANSVSLDKKYVNGTTETENLSVSPNGIVTVRVKYNNTGNQSVTDAQIKDSLPAGFVYQGGSFKNCLTQQLKSFVIP